MTSNARRAILLIVTSGIIASVLGAVIAAIGSVVYLVAVFPIILGLAAGYATGRMARRLHLRQIRRVGTLGAASGLLAILVMLSATWSIHRSELVTEVTNRLGGSDSMVTRTVELWVKDTAGGAPATLAPLTYRIHSGLRLFESQRLDLGLGFNLLILLMEAGLASYGAWRFSIDWVGDPYCEHCQAWTSRRIVGTAALGAFATIKNELQLGQWHRLGRRLQAPTGTGPVSLNCHMCDTCEHTDVRFELDITESGKRARTMVKTSAPYTALQDIWDSQQMTRVGRQS